MDFHTVNINESAGSVQLMCTLNINISSNVTVTWLHNGAVATITPPNGVIQTGNTTTLVIGNFRVSDAGVYQCVFNDTFNGWILKRSINVTLKELCKYSVINRIIQIEILNMSRDRAPKSKEARNMILT